MMMINLFFLNQNRIKMSKQLNNQDCHTDDPQQAINDIVNTIKDRLTSLEDHKSSVSTVINAFNRAEMADHPFANILKFSNVKRNERILQLKGALVILE